MALFFSPTLTNFLRDKAAEKIPGEEMEYELNFVFLSTTVKAQSAFASIPILDSNLNSWLPFPVLQNQIWAVLTGSFDCFVQHFIGKVVQAHQNFDSS